MSRRRRRRPDPAQFDLFRPAHEKCEDGRGPYLQFLIAPPTELGELAAATLTSGRALKVLEAEPGHPSSCSATRLSNLHVREP